MERLDSIATVRLGRQRSPKNHSGDQMRPYLRAANVGWNGLRLDDILRMNFTDAEMTSYRLADGDLLLNEASGSPTEVGKPAIWHNEIDDCAFQNTLIRVRAHRASPEYLLHYFRYAAATGQFAAASKGVGIRHLGQETLASWPVPLPPPGEQQRIVTVLSRADDARVKRGETLARLNELVQSIFLDMFGDIVANDRGWPACRVGSLVDRFEAGRSLQSDHEADDVAVYRILKISSVTSGEFLPDESKPCPADHVPRESHFLRPGDLLFSRANTAELVGATALVGDCPPNLLLPDKLWRFVWRSPKSVEPVFVRQLFHQPKFRQLISATATGSSGSMKNISQAKLLSMPCVMPPYGLQSEFAEKVSRIQGLRAAHRVSLHAHDDLFASLRYRAFRGEL